MAKFKLEKEIGNLNSLVYNYNTAAMGIDESSSTSITISDSDGDRIVYTGKNLTLESGTPTGGTVTKVEFFDDEGALLLTISGAKYKLIDIDLNQVLSNFNLFEKGNDTFTGSSTGDVIMYGANAGNDKIYGLGGNDYIYGSAGSNLFDGGAGNKDVVTWELITYKAGMKGVIVDLAKGTALNPWGKTDTLVDVEDIRGTKFNDVFKGSSKNEFFSGQDGNDTYTGGKGKDEFEFSRGGGKDKITDFGDGDDTVSLYGMELPDFRALKGLMEQSGNNVVIDFGGGDILTLLNTKKGDFNAADFDLNIF
jgi:serralysin